MRKGWEKKWKITDKWWLKKKLGSDKTEPTTKKIVEDRVQFNAKSAIIKKCGLLDGQLLIKSKTGLKWLRKNGFQTLLKIVVCLMGNKNYLESFISCFNALFISETWSLWCTSKVFVLACKNLFTISSYKRSNRLIFCWKARTCGDLGKKSRLLCHASQTSKLNL